MVILKNFFLFNGYILLYKHNFFVWSAKISMGDQDTIVSP